MGGETPVQFGEGDSRPVSFTHPLTMADGSNNPLELSANLSPEERVRLFCDAGRLGEYNQIPFTSLFPNGLKLNADFDEGSIIQTEETRLTDADKAVRAELLKSLGLVSPRKTEEQDSSFIPQLHVAFTRKPDALVTQINELPMMKRLESINQTSLMPGKTRADHSKHLMTLIAKDAIRFALQTPELINEKATRDMPEFTALYNRDHPDQPLEHPFTMVPTAQTKALVSQAFEHAYHIESIESIPKTKIEAVQIAYEYLKYMLIDAALHDAETPGWGDVFMKTWNWSEDRALAENIESMVSDPSTGIPTLLEKQSKAGQPIDAKLLATMVRSTSFEGDTRLPGLMFKDKRSPEHIDREHKHLAMGASVDGDRESGTITDTETIAEQVLPGGFRHLRKGDPLPQLSFEARAMLLTYGLLGGLNAAKMRVSLEQLFKGARDHKGKDIDVNLIYIAAEEVSMCQNRALMIVPVPVRGENGDDTIVDEIMPVAVVPGDVKKALLMSNILYLGYFHGQAREGIERFVGDLIRKGKADGFLKQTMFVNRTDYEVNRELETIAPIIKWVMYHLKNNASILTEKELLERSQNGMMPKAFIREIHMGRNVVQLKSGTMIRMNERGGIILPAGVALAHKRDQSLDEPTDPLSPMGRFLGAGEALASAKLYVMIELDDSQIRTINGELAKVSATRDAFMGALSEWAKPITIGQSTLESVLPFGRR